MNFGSRIHFVAHASEKTETISDPSPHRRHRNAHYRSTLLRNGNSRRLVAWHFQDWNSGAFWRNGGSAPLTSHPAATSRCANVAHSVLHRCFWAARFQRNLRPSQHADHAHRPHHRDRCGNPRLHPAAARLHTYSHWRDRRRVRPEQHIWLGASSSARDRVVAAWRFLVQPFGTYELRRACGSRADYGVSAAAEARSKDLRWYNSMVFLRFELFEDPPLRISWATRILRIL